MSVFENYVPAVAQALQQRGLEGECAVCRKKGQQMIHGLPIAVPVYEEAGEVKYPGTSMPAAAVICNQCGAVQFFSLGALGLISPPGGGEAKAGDAAAN